MAKVISKSKSPTKVKSSKKPIAPKKKAGKKVHAVHAAEMGIAGSVFNSIKIARLRIYTDGRVFAYKAPGHNVNYIGYSRDTNIIKALFLARDNGRGITGYTDNTYQIAWMDY